MRGHFYFGPKGTFLSQSLHAWYNGWSEHSRDDMLGQSPDDLFAAAAPRRQLADASVLDYCLQLWHQPVRVGRNGVTISPKGKPISFGQFDESLRALIRTKHRVHVSYDPADMRTVRCYLDADGEPGRFVCEAKMNTVGGARDAISLEHVGEAIKEQARHNRVRKEYQRDALKFVTNSTAHLAAEKARPKRDKPTDAPSMKLIQTPLDGTSNGHQQARVRKAAGAEHHDQDDPADSVLDRLRGISKPAPRRSLLPARPMPSMMDLEAKRAQQASGNDHDFEFPEVSLAELRRQYGVQDHSSDDLDDLLTWKGGAL